MLRSRRRQEPEDTANPTRPQRGLGPFTGGQLTVLVLAITAAIAFPIGASAVTGTTAFVTDHASGATAKVDASGHLSVSSTPPASSYNSTFFYVFSTNSCDAVTPPVPKDTVLIVQAVKVSIVSTTTSDPVFVTTIAAKPAKPGDPCVRLGDAVDITSVPGQGLSTNVEFPQGLPIKRGHVVGMHVGSLTGDVVATAEVKGYLAPLSECTKTAPPVGCW